MTDKLKLSGAVREIPLGADGKALREVRVIAREIRDNWMATYLDNPRKPSFLHHALPYLQAMYSLKTTSRVEKYGLEDAQMIVLYFLNSITQWRGEFAKGKKAELNDLLKRQNP